MATFPNGRVPHLLTQLEDCACLFSLWPPTLSGMGTLDRRVTKSSASKKEKVAWGASGHHHYKPSSVA